MWRYCGDTVAISGYDGAEYLRRGINIGRFPVILESS